MTILSRYKHYILYITIVLLIILGVIFYTSYTVFSVANTSYTYSDIEKYHHVEKMVAEVTGGEEVSRSDVVYNLSLAALQKEYLIGNSINFTKIELIQAVEEATELKGLYSQIKDYLGDDYYRLFIEPVAVGRVASNVFEQNNPRARVAQRILQKAAAQGLQSTAEEVQVALLELNIDTSSNNQLATLLLSWVNELEAKQEELTVGAKVYPNLLDTEDSYLIVAHKEKSDTGFILNGVQIPKQNYVQYMATLAKELPPRFTWVSLYNIEDMQAKRNSIY